MKTIHLANALVTNSKQEMLAVRKIGSMYFQMVGGKIEGKELPIETLKREFLEEINVDIDKHNVSFLGEHQTQAVNEKDTLVHAQVFHVELNGNVEVKISAEIEEYVWIDFEHYHNFKLAHLLEEFSLPIWLDMQK